MQDEAENLHRRAQYKLCRKAVLCHPERSRRTPDSVPDLGAGLAPAETHKGFRDCLFERHVGIGASVGDEPQTSGAAPGDKHSKESRPSPRAGLGVGGSDRAASRAPDPRRRSLHPGDEKLNRQG